MIGPTPAIIERSSRKLLPTMRPSCSATTPKKPGCAINPDTSPVGVMSSRSKYAQL